MDTIGLMGLISLISHTFFIGMTWYVMQGINFEVIVRKHRVLEAQIFLIFIAIVIGSMVSNFILDMIRWSQDLIFLF